MDGHGARFLPCRSHRGAGARCGSGRGQRAERSLRARALPGRAPGARGMIEEKAQELGRLIGQSPEYQTLRRAEKSLQEDAETRARLEKIDQLAGQLDEQVAARKVPEVATVL